MLAGIESSLESSVKQDTAQDKIQDEILQVKRWKGRGKIGQDRTGQDRKGDRALLVGILAGIGPSIESRTRFRTR
jgi:hypothetical protein